MVTAPIAVNERGVEGPSRPSSRRSFKRAAGIAIGTVALAAFAVLLAGAYEDHLLSPPGVPGASAVQLPGDLFTAPRAPMPRVIVRYGAPRSTASTPAGTSATPTAQTSPSQRHHPSPSPSPGGGDD